MAYNMKGSPAKLGNIQGTAGHRSALKKLSSLIPSAKTRDKIKSIKRKVGDAATYAKGFYKELMATKGSGMSGGKFPHDEGARALRARKRGVSVKSAGSLEGMRDSPLRPANVDKYGRKKKAVTTPPKTVQGKADAISKMRKTHARDKAVKNYKK